MLPESSQKVVDYWWPVVSAYTYLQLAKDYTDEQVKKVMEEYMTTKTFLVRERKEMMRKVLELIEEFNESL